MNNTTKAPADHIPFGTIGSQVTITYCECRQRAWLDCCGHFGGTCLRDGLCCCGNQLTTTRHHTWMVGNVIEIRGAGNGWVIEEANPFSRKAPVICSHASGIEGRGWLTRRVHGSNVT